MFYQNQINFTKEDENLSKLNNFFNTAYLDDSCELKDKVKQLCVEELSKNLGLSIKINHHKKFLHIYSSIMGQAVCSHLNVNLNIAPCELKFFKYDGINYVSHAEQLLKNSPSAFLDMYNFLETKKDSLEDMPIVF